MLMNALCGQDFRDRIRHWHSQKESLDFIAAELPDDFQLLLRLNAFHDHLHAEVWARFTREFTIALVSGRDSIWLMNERSIFRALKGRLGR